MSVENSEGVFQLGYGDTQTLQGLATDKPPYGQRAQMLLALAGGDDLKDAAAKSGLSVNQARHWRGRFRTQGMSIFPGDLVARHTAVPALPRQESLGLLSAPPTSPLLQSPPALEALPAATAITGKKTKKRSQKQKSADKGSKKKSKGKEKSKTKNKGKKKKKNKDKSQKSKKRK